MHVGRMGAGLSTMSAGSDGPWSTFTPGMNGRGAAAARIVVGHRWVELEGLERPGRSPWFVRACGGRWGVDGCHVYAARVGAVGSGPRRVTELQSRSTADRCGLNTPRRVRSGRLERLKWKWKSKKSDIGMAWISKPMLLLLAALGPLGTSLSKPAAGAAPIAPGVRHVDLDRPELGSSRGRSRSLFRHRQHGRLIDRG